MSKKRRAAATAPAASAPEPTPDGAAELPGTREGVIVEGSRGFYRVETPEGALVCTIRGRLRKQLQYALSDATAARRSAVGVRVRTHDPVSVGDRVRVLPTVPGEGVIEAVVTRAGGDFGRRDPDAGQDRLRAVAGIDQLVTVFAAREPAPHLGLLDRFLVLAENQELDTLICLNKADLGVEPWLAERLAVYRGLGYPVVLTSAAAGLGLDELRGRLAGRTSAFLGPSGVGKSSLLNALQPDLGLRVGAVSASTSKGRHTTRGTHLFPLDGPDGGHIADTAGIRALAVDGAALGRLDWCFREFRPYLDECRFAGCSHLHEPDCAVRAAAATGAIDRARYASYGKLRRGEGE